MTTTNAHIVKMNDHRYACDLQRQLLQFMTTSSELSGDALATAQKQLRELQPTLEDNSSMGFLDQVITYLGTISSQKDIEMKKVAARPSSYPMYGRGGAYSGSSNFREFWYISGQAQQIIGGSGKKYKYTLNPYVCNNGLGQCNRFGHLDKSIPGLNANHGPMWVPISQLYERDFYGPTREEDNVKWALVYQPKGAYEIRVYAGRYYIFKVGEVTGQGTRTGCILDEYGYTEVYPHVDCQNNHLKDAITEPFTAFLDISVEKDWKGETKEHVEYGVKRNVSTILIRKQTYGRIIVSDDKDELKKEKTTALVGGPKSLK